MCGFFKVNLNLKAYFASTCAGCAYAKLLFLFEFIKLSPGKIVELCGSNYFRQRLLLMPLNCEHIILLRIV